MGTCSVSGRRLKVVLIAPSCNCNGVGEDWSSFHWISGLAMLHDVTLLTTYKGNTSVASMFKDVQVVEWPRLRSFEKWERLNAMAKPAYVTFYFHARQWLLNQLRSGASFDLVHQISPLALRYPSPAAGLPIPLIVGPLAGSLETPEAFKEELGGAPWYTKLRSIDRWRLRHDPVLRHTYACADRIIGVAPYIRDLLQDVPAREVEIMSETGVNGLPPPRGKRAGRGLRLLFVGRVIRPKGVRDAIRAIAKLGDVMNLTFDVVGDGDDLSACKDEAMKLGTGDRVSFHGRLPRSEVDTFYANADVFLFPSFREPSGNVVLEAMSYGLPMIVAERGGPGFVVDDCCGFRVPVINPDQFASDLAACIRKLVGNPGLIESMGGASREKIRREFLWDAKIARMTNIYHAMLAKSAGTHSRALRIGVESIA